MTPFDIVISTFLGKPFGDSFDVVKLAQALPKPPSALMQTLRPLLLSAAQRAGSRPLLHHVARTANFSSSRTRPALAGPLNLPKWLEENSHLLKPPINNYCVTNDDMTVMIVGGPNARTDYHINSTPEFFYQYRGPMLLKTVQPSLSASSASSSASASASASASPPNFRDIPIREGELYLLPPNTPHNPVRFANTVGIVLEQPRPQDSVDRLRWYCQSCGSQVHEASFHCTDLGSQIKDAVNAFKADAEARRCRKCGETCDVAPKPEKMAEMEGFVR